MHIYVLPVYHNPKIRLRAGSKVTKTFTRAIFSQRRKSVKIVELAKSEGKFAPIMVL